MRPSWRPFLAVTAVLLLGGVSTCVIPSDERLFADDATLVDLPELDGTFVYEGDVPFEIVRLGGGQYEYVGPITELPDIDRVTPAEAEALEARFRALGLPEPEQTSSGGTIPLPAFEPQLLELDLLCPPAAWYEGRRCARRLAELLEPDYPGVVAFEEAIGALPSLQFRERARFSLHELGPGRLAGQGEEVFEIRFRPVAELNERWGETSPVWKLYFWADALRPGSRKRGEHEEELLVFEAWMRPNLLTLLRAGDDGSFAIQPTDACLNEEHLAAYGFTLRQPEEPDEEDPGSIVAGPDADIVGLLNACFPEEPAEVFRFWKIDALPPATGSSAG
jgi:hypothetical protein